jgi:PAS domain S-box-containing protein
MKHFIIVTIDKYLMTITVGSFLKVIFGITGIAGIRGTGWLWLAGIILLETAVIVILGIFLARFKHRQKKIEKREEQLSLAFEAISEGVWDCEIPSGKDYFSDEWLRHLGYESGELEEHTDSWKNIVHPEDLPSVLDEVHRHMRGETPFYQTEHRCRTKDGRWIWVLDRGKVVERDADGKPLRMIGAQRDITARKAAEQSLEESERRYRTIVENIADGMIKHDLNGIIMEVNDHLCTMTGFSREELLGKSIAILTEEGSENTVVDNINELLEKRTLLFRWKVRKKDGTVIHTSVNSSLVIHNDEHHIQSFLRDISLRVKMEEELLRTSELAEKANQAKSEFLANMSHEIRTPMNAILGFTELTLDTDLTGEQRENLSAVMESSNDLMVIINDILDFSKIEAGKLDLVPRKLNLYRTIQDVLDLVKQAAADKGLELRSLVDTNAPEYIIADPVRLRQVLANLVNNAVKFTQEGSVEIRVELHRQEDIIGATSMPDHPPLHHRGYETAVIQFAVNDTGIGIPEDRLSEIFDYFTQVDGSTARKFGGTGLGLSISRKLVELMGGRIWVDSIHGTGSTFYFTITAEVPLPVQAAVESTHMSDEEFEHYREFVTRKPLNILLADDKPTNLLITTRLLEKEGHRLVSVPDGNEALKAYENETFDCVLMDIQMPVMDGFQATRRIRALEQYTGTRVPIIAMTAHAMTGDREKCFDEGMDDYIAKPVRIADLRKILVKWAYIDLQNE